MTKTTDNLPPIGSDIKFVNDKGKLTAESHSWMTASRDQVLGKNRISDIQKLTPSSAISPISDLMRIKSVDGTGQITLTSNPQIRSDFDGRQITLEGVSDTDSVKIVNGNGLFLKEAKDIELKNNITITLHYTQTKNLWIEN